MGRKKREKREAPRDLDVGAMLRWILRILPLAVVLVGGAQAFHTVERFLLEDPRFELGAGRPASSADIRVRGIVHAPRNEVEAVFAEDAGKSVYVLPIGERRRSMLAIDWVRDATVMRLWPNRIDVFIRERQPVAFVQLSPRESSQQVALIDEEGVILTPPEKSRYDLPVLTGIDRGQSEPARGERVRTALALIGEFGPHAAKVSEIDVTRPDNMVATFGIDGNAVVLLLGDKNFRRRLEHFLSHYAEIHRHLPEATKFDLRLDDRITAVDGAEARD